MPHKLMIATNVAKLYPSQVNHYLTLWGKYEKEVGGKVGKYE